MSALGRGASRTTAAVRAVNWAGVARLAVAGGAVAGVLWAATTQSYGLDLAAATGDDRAPVTQTALTTRVSQVCSGNELSGIPGLPDVTVPATVTAAAGPADLLPAPAPAGGALTASSGGRELFSVDTRPGTATADVPKQGAVGITGDSGFAPAVAATQEWRADAKDLRGLVTSTCGTASTDQWLLAGGAGPGRLERLVLTNPGANPVTASVEVHGGAGLLGDASVQTVAPGGRVSLLLDARYQEEATPAVHVTTDGAGVHATLTDTWITGSTALGAETVGASAAPSRSQVLPGVVVGAGPTVLRVVAPTDQSAVVRVDLVGRNGFAELSGDSVLSVTGGGVAELALTGVPAGTYSVVLRADAPIVGAVQSRVGNGKAPGEFAWTASAPAIAETGGAALPAASGVARSFQLVSTQGSTTADVTTVVDGTPVTRSVSILSERATAVNLEGVTSVWVHRTSGSGRLRGTLVSSWGAGATRMLSSTPLLESVVSSPVSRAFPLP